MGRVLTSIAPSEPEAHGLHALMELNASRTAARTDAVGEPILMLDQNRALWDQLQIRRGMQALARARKLSDNVILMPGHDFSVAPFFLRPISRLIMWHAVRIHAIVQRVSAETNVMFVDLFRDPNAEPFVREPRRYYCPDGLHPSGEGYAIWFAALLAQVPLARFLAEGGSD